MVNYNPVAADLGRWLLQQDLEQDWEDEIARKLAEVLEEFPEWEEDSDAAYAIAEQQLHEEIRRADAEFDANCLTSTLGGFYGK